MKKMTMWVVFVALASGWAWTQGSSSVPQTARQALLEMFFSKTPGTLAKHLPAVTLNALEKSGALAGLQQYSTMASQFQTQGKNFETFETGSVLLSAEDPKSGQKFEVTVENDALRGDEDDIEVSFQTYKEKQPQRTPFLPRMTFGMKMESGIWKLNEIQVTVRVPLADPDFLKSIGEGIKARMAATAPPQAPASTTTFGPDASVVAAMRSILAAENSYKNTYRAVGYTCVLSDLDGFGGGEPNWHQAMLIPSGLAGGRKYGYVFTLSGCAGTPASSFHLVATPGGSGMGRGSFCADQTGAMRSIAGDAGSCWTGGSAVP